MLLTNQSKKEDEKSIIEGLLVALSLDHQYKIDRTKNPYESCCDVILSVNNENEIVAVELTSFVAFESTSFEKNKTFQINNECKNFKFKLEKKFENTLSIVIDSIHLHKFIPDRNSDDIV